MTNREHPHTSKPGMAEKSRRHMGGKGDQDALLKEREHDVKTGGTVGREVPDESKERHTEIAVEAGNQGTERQKTTADSE